MEREKWVDNLKGFAIILVVVGHAIEGGITRGLVSGMEANVLGCIYDIIYSFHMPLFFTISGYLYFNLTKTSKNKMIVRICNHFFDYVVVSVLYIVVRLLVASELMSEVNAKQVLTVLWEPVGPYWYLWVMMIYYAIFFWGIKKIDTKLIWMIVITMNLAGNCFSTWFSGAVYKLLISALFFYLGIKIKEYDFIVKKWLILICGSWGALTLSLTMMFISWDVEDVPVLNTVVAITITMFIIGLYRNSSSCDRVLSYLGKKTLPIYLFHLFFVTAAFVVMGQFGVGSLMSVVIAVACGGLGSLGVDWVLKKMGIAKAFYGFADWVTGKAWIGNKSKG